MPGAGRSAAKGRRRPLSTSYQSCHNHVVMRQQPRFAFRSRFHFVLRIHMRYMSICRFRARVAADAQPPLVPAGRGDRRLALEVLAAAHRFICMKPIGRRLVGRILG